MNANAANWPLWRGQVVLADMGLPEPKLFVVVSNNRRNRAFDNVLCARITTTLKSPIPSMVPIGSDEQIVGTVVCDDLYVIYQEEVLRRQGALSTRTMWAVNLGLAEALGLGE